MHQTYKLESQASPCAQVKVPLILQLRKIRLRKNKAKKVSEESGGRTRIRTQILRDLPSPCDSMFQSEDPFASRQDKGGEEGIVGRKTLIERANGQKQEREFKVSTQMVARTPRWVPQTWHSSSVHQGQDKRKELYIKAARP